MNEWVKSTCPIFHKNWEWVPPFVFLGKSVYGQEGPRYEITPCLNVSKQWQATMYLGNCAWRIADDTFELKEHAKEFCERHAFEHFKITK